MLLPLSKANILLLIASSLLATATAQDSSTAEDDLPTSSAPPDPSPYPTATIFLPGNLHELPGNGRNLAASVITAVSWEHLIQYQLDTYSDISTNKEREPNCLRHWLHGYCSQRFKPRPSGLHVAVYNHCHWWREYADLHLQSDRDDG